MLGMRYFILFKIPSMFPPTLFPQLTEMYKEGERQAANDRLLRVCLWWDELDQKRWGWGALEQVWAI